MVHCVGTLVDRLTLMRAEYEMETVVADQSILKVVPVK